MMIDCAASTLLFLVVLFQYEIWHVIIFSYSVFFSRYKQTDSYSSTSLQDFRSVALHTIGLVISVTVQILTNQAHLQRVSSFS